MRGHRALELPCRVLLDLLEAEHDPLERDRGLRAVEVLDVDQRPQAVGVRDPRALDVIERVGEDKQERVGGVGGPSMGIVADVADPAFAFIDGDGWAVGIAVRVVAVEVCERDGGQMGIARYLVALTWVARDDRGMGIVTCVVSGKS